MKITISLPLVTILIFTLLVCGCGRIMVDRSKGSAFVVKVEPNSDDKDGLTERAMKMIEQRLNAFAIAGDVALDKDSADQISVKIYGATDLEKIKKFLFTVNQLELKEFHYPDSRSNSLEIFPTRESAQQKYQDY